MHAPLKDIADEVGTSITTVSKVLNGKEIRVSEDKRQEILAVAERLKYLPNISGVNLRKGCTDLIAVIVGDLLCPYYAKLLKEMSDLISSRGKSVIVCDIDNNEEMERKHYQRLKSGYVDGAIIVPSPINRSEDNVKQVTKILSGIDMPILMVSGDGGEVYPDFTTVGTDSEKCGYIATKHLIELGHRRIAYVSEPRETGRTNPRLWGYIAALQEADIPYQPEWVALGRTRYNGGRTAYQELVGHGVTAAVCSSDMLAIGFAGAAMADGCLVPQNCSVIGMDRHILPHVGGGGGHLQALLDQVVPLHRRILLDHVQDSHRIHRLVRPKEFADGQEQPPIGLIQEVLRPELGQGGADTPLINEHGADHRGLGNNGVQHVYHIGNPLSSTVTGVVSGDIIARCDTSSHRLFFSHRQAYGIPIPRRQSSLWTWACRACPIIRINSSSGLSLSHSREAPALSSPRACSR